MAGLPVLKARDVLRAVQDRFRREARVRQPSFSHRDDPARFVVVPHHGAKDLKPGTLRNVIRQAGLSVEEFRRLL
jgi:predicted RNA binding protein YcfA (HicA-like mRNA interferase family)